jgi:hypothetical protein
MIIVDRDLAWRDKQVLGDHLVLTATSHDRQRAVRLDVQADLLADEPDRHRVARRADPNRTHASRSTLRVTDLPMLARSDGNAASSSRSMINRSAGTAQISECITALTCTHHVAAAVFAAPRSVNGSPDPSTPGIIRSVLA